MQKKNVSGFRFPISASGFFSPARIILYSIIILVLGGTALLALPGMSRVPIAFIDLLFTSASAITSTGLLTIPFDQFTPLGHAIIVLLIQVGAIGIITIGVFFISLFVDIRFLSFGIANELLNISAPYKAKKILFFVLSVTLSIELIGTLYFTTIFMSSMPLHTAFLTGLFQAVCAFCNTGLTLLPVTTLMAYRVSLPTTVLVFLGGFGFIPLYEVFRYILAIFYKKRFVISLYTTIIVRTSITVLIGSSMLFWLIEKNYLLAQMSTAEQLLRSIMHCIDFKSAGFFTGDPAIFQYPTILLMLFITFIGSSPGSMGSGIKISTFAVCAALIKATIRGNQSIVMYWRTISTSQARKAVAIIMLSFVWVMTTIFCILMSEPNIPFPNILCEATTAFTNIGTPFGVATHASYLGKFFLLMSMIVGKIGTISFIVAMKTKNYNDTGAIVYPQEDILLG